MKIVHVEDYFDPSAGYQINELLSASKYFEHEVYLITSMCMKPFHKEVDLFKDREFELKTGVKIIRLKPLLIVSTRVLYKNLFKEIKNINPDIVFFHGIGDFKDLLLFTSKKNYKIIRDCHMSWIASQNRFKKLYYMIFKLIFSPIINNTEKYSRVYALGSEEYDYLIRLGISKKKIDYLYHGYNDEIMYYDEAARKCIRKKYFINDEDILIGYIGKFDFNKRPDIIFDILHNLGEKYIVEKKLKLMFIGSKEEQYMKEIFNNKLNEFHGLVEVIVEESKEFIELKDYFSASDICIFPKECTLSSIHAQICRSLVIMENHKSNKERVEHNDNLYEMNDFKDASNILKKIIENKEYKKTKQIDNVYFNNREYKQQIKNFIKDIEK